MTGALRVFVDRLVPASLFGGQTAFHALAKIDGALRNCTGAGAAASVLEESKADLYGVLAQRFSPPAAQALTLKILNLFLSRHHFHARDTLLLSRPFGLIVDPSNMCELACPGCVHSEHAEELKLFDWKKGTLGDDRLRALLRQYGPYAIGIYFCNYGEPLLNRNTPNLIRMAKRYLIATALSTSLSVRRFDAEAYVESGLDFMVVSIDGTTQSVYETFRRNGNLDLAFANIRSLVNAKRKLGKRTPVLSWNFLAFEHNAHQIPLAERLARQLGVNVFRVVNPFDVRWDDPNLRPAAVRPYVRRLDWTSISNPPENWNPFPESVEADAIADAFAAALNGREVGIRPNYGHTCHWLYKNMAMDARGRILPCCGAPRPDTKLVFAKLDAASGDVFNSEMYRQARAFFRQGGSPGPGDGPYCARCEWDQETVNIGGPEIRRYFRAADPSFFDRRSVELLAGW